MQEQIRRICVSVEGGKYYGIQQYNQLNGFKFAPTTGALQRPLDYKTMAAANNIAIAIKLVVSIISYFYYKLS